MVGYCTTRSVLTFVLVNEGGHQRAFTSTTHAHDCNVRLSLPRYTHSILLICFIVRYAMIEVKIASITGSNAKM